jgi:hypothetical protein
MLVENLQRPSWVRAVERLVGRFVGAATYGPLQREAGHALPDSEALDASIKSDFAGRTVPRSQTEYGSERIDEGWIRVFARSYNPSNSYADDVVAAYWWLESGRESDSLLYTEFRAGDGLPRLRFGRLRCVTAAYGYPEPRVRSKATSLFNNWMRAVFSAE